MSKRSRILLERLRNIAGKDDPTQGLRHYSDFRSPDEFVKWETVSWDSVDTTVFNDVGYPWNVGARKNPISRPEIKQWCEENCKNRYISYRNKIYFESPDDATLFILTWT